MTPTTRSRTGSPRSRGRHGHDRDEAGDARLNAGRRGRRLASVPGMATAWPRTSYGDWSETCDTLHAHTQVLGKLAVALAPPEPQLQHAALRLTARGWETLPLPAPDGSGALVVALDLHAHEAVVEHSDGRVAPRRRSTPDRPVGEVTRELLAAVARARRRRRDRPDAAGGAVDGAARRGRRARAPTTRRRSPTYFAAATRAALVLAAFRAPYRGRSTPVNAWWGSFDLAVSLFSGLPAEPPSDDFIMRNAMDAQEVAVGWWPGDARYGRAAFYAYAHPAPEGFAQRDARARGRALGRRARRVHPRLGRRPRGRRPARAALEFARSAFATPARCAGGTRRSPRAPRGRRRRSPDAGRRPLRDSRRAACSRRLRQLRRRRAS